MAATDRLKELSTTQQRDLIHDCYWNPGSEFLFIEYLAPIGLVIGEVCLEMMDRLDRARIGGAGQVAYDEDLVTLRSNLRAGQRWTR
jgi:hypothetical protein